MNRSKSSSIYLLKEENQKQRIDGMVVTFQVRMTRLKKAVRYSRIFFLKKCFHGFLIVSFHRGTENSPLFEVEIHLFSIHQTCYVYIYIHMHMYIFVHVVSLHLYICSNFFALLMFISSQSKEYVKHCESVCSSHLKKLEMEQ